MKGTRKDFWRMGSLTAICSVSEGMIFVKHHNGWGF